MSIKRLSWQMRRLLEELYIQKARDRRAAARPFRIVISAHIVICFGPRTSFFHRNSLYIIYIMLYTNNI